MVSEAVRNMQADAIKYIQFGVVSPEYIRKISVAKLIVPDTYNEDGYPIDGGLVDQRLGVIEPGLKCKTCGGRSKSCVGHFGHIELVRPVVHPEYARTIYILLQATCSSCSRVLFDEKRIDMMTAQLRRALAADADYRAEQAMEGDEPGAARAASIKKLKSVQRCPHCGAEQKRIKLERPTTFTTDGNRIKSDELRDRLSRIPDSDLRLLGIDASVTRPEWFVLTTLLVPPVNVRPSVTLESGERSEDDLTHKLVDIIRINQRLEQDIDVGAPQIIIDDLWELLQYHITVYFNNETPGVPVARHRSTRPLKTLAQRLKGKEGRIRYNLSGKRVNFCARTVVSPDVSLTIDEVGVPMRIAENLTTPLHVTRWNIEEARAVVQRASYPTAQNVILRDGTRKRVADANREELAKALQPGDIVERQLVDGDIVLFNRQPTLHRLSIMAHTARVLPGRTLRLSTAAVSPYNADFDGDEMNLHVPQSLEAQAEAWHLMRPQQLLLSATDGRPAMFLEEDAMIGAYLLTRKEAKMDKSEACMLLASIGIYRLPEPDEDGSYSGKSIFSMLLPEDAEFEFGEGGNEVVIKKGKLLRGIIDQRLVGIDGGVLLLYLFERYGPECASRFIFNLMRLGLRLVYAYGMTTSVSDYYTIEPLAQGRKRIVEETGAKAAALVEQYKSGKISPLPGYTARETLGVELMAELNEARAKARSLIAKYLDMSNNALFIAQLAGRGSISNLVQTSMFLGQQAVRGKRVSRGYSGRVLPYLKPGSTSPAAMGFVRSCFFDGLKPVEFYMHAMGARDSMMSKSLVTAVSGYLHRRLINALQDMYTDETLAVRDARGTVVQSIYGGDGIDPMMVRAVKMRGRKE